MGKVSVGSIIFQFIVGGFVVAGTTILAADFSTKTAALFWAIPFTMIPVLVFMHLKKKPKQRIVDFVADTFPSMILLLLYILLLWGLLKKFNFWVSLGLSAVGFGILAVIYWFVICPSKLPCINIK